MRDEFSTTALRRLRDRVAGLCSRPECRRLTIGPTDDFGVMNVGEAAHITAASPGGPRYDPSLLASQRSDLANAIWLCRTCHGIVDTNEAAFSAELLRNWKADAEAYARRMVNGAAGQLLADPRFLDLRATNARSLPQLRFAGITDVDSDRVEAVAGATGAVEIVYADPIEHAVGELRQRDRDPDSYASGNPRRVTMEPTRRTEIAAHSHARNKQLLIGAGLMAESNAAGLYRLLVKLDELQASSEERRFAVSTFGALAALRMIRLLKQGYDWRDGEIQPWFESFQFGASSFLPLVPDDSQTGLATFGSRYWCNARVGRERTYKYVMFPLREALTLFQEAVQGDRVAFFTWVVPQLFDSEEVALQPGEGRISVEDWEPFLLAGSDREWWSRNSETPWPDIIRRLRFLEPPVARQT